MIKFRTTVINVLLFVAFIFMSLVIMKSDINKLVLSVKCFMMKYLKDHLMIYGHGKQLGPCGISYSSENT